MPRFARFFFSTLFLLGFISGVILMISAFALVLYVFGDSDYPGTLLLWVREPRVLVTLVFLVIISLTGSVRINGGKFWSGLLVKAEKKFDALADKF